MANAFSEACACLRELGVSELEFSVDGWDCEQDCVSVTLNGVAWAQLERPLTLDELEALPAFQTVAAVVSATVEDYTEEWASAHGEAIVRTTDEASVEFDVTGEVVEDVLFCDTLRAVELMGADE